MSRDPLDQVRSLLPGATFVQTPFALVIVVPSAGATAARGSDDDHLAEHEALALTKKSKRQLADARRSGVLGAYGGQRSRTYKRGELIRWLEERRSKPVTVDDADIDRRVMCLAKARQARTLTRAR
jgi:hypothetical protein